ncbi:hypothetical protein PFLUV_G00110640 [Perca fluviatilis]|uniref:Uncharacterized protein n=1 Tax=Perca fluviatilis TaxID=8168 RepID=A0A6A5FC56_PERFL|nr:hypothetical protein PFLUV_G00110640 [Perca fluviatilis]
MKRQEQKEVCLHWLNYLFGDLKNRWSPILGSSASSWISCRNKTCSTKHHVKRLFTASLVSIVIRARSLTSIL